MIVVYDTSEIDLCRDQLTAINESLESMPDSVEPKYDSTDYTYIKYHPTEDKICLPLELGRFEEWDIVIEEALTRPYEEMTEDWNNNEID